MIMDYCLLYQKALPKIVSYVTSQPDDGDGDGSWNVGNF
jgi:hypothetical protein